MFHDFFNTRNNGNFLVKMSVCRVYSILICQITDIIYICNLTFKEYTLVVSTLLRLIYDLMVQVKLGALTRFRYVQMTNEKLLYISDAFHHPRCNMRTTSDTKESSFYVNLLTSDLQLLFFGG